MPALRSLRQRHAPRASGRSPARSHAALAVVLPAALEALQYVLWNLDRLPSMSDAAAATLESAAGLACGCLFLPIKPFLMARSEAAVPSDMASVG